MSSAATFGIIAAAVLIIAAVLNFGILVYVHRDIKKSKVSLARTLQTLGHLFSAIMAMARCVFVIMGDADCPTWIAAIFSISSFFYQFFSNIYYIELLKAISVDSKIFSKRNIQIFQWFTAAFVFGSSGGTLFRYTIYIDQSSNNWASRVSHFNIVGGWISSHACLFCPIGIRWCHLCVSCFRSIDKLRCSQNQGRI
jgi:hypothetical protein